MAAKRISTLLAFTLAVVVVLGGVGLYRLWHKDGLRLVEEDLRPVDKPAAVSLVVVTHGWVEKGKGGWPEEMAEAIAGQVDANLWHCGYFDWRKGAMTINPVDAARYARDVAGAELAGQVLRPGAVYEHIHLIGHSSGAWVVNEAAKILAEKTSADIHLTFFDAFVPSNWDERLLGDIRVKLPVELWVDHYYTRDYTLRWTQYDLTFAHNVDVTAIDQNIKDHNFPWKWYHASVTGKYPKGHFLNDKKLVLVAEGIGYGFSRSKEGGGEEPWKRSLTLDRGNKAVRIEK